MKQTKLDEMKAAARAVGLCLDDWSPGDGLTRYRFFEIKTRYCKCSQADNYHPFHVHDGTNYQTMTAGKCRGIYRNVPGTVSAVPCNCEAFEPRIDDKQDYFSSDGIYTALGRKEALTWLRGRGARI